ncbi:unnamed protein product [Cuscuta campestris]|uniref:Uncharacterized protein n=1 Tax=Cuscuta campestris TaxID=132261 RepID=A0A484M5X9_9ASTE|nr:unnamed protein product [Cuscuta campestris]
MDKSPLDMRSTFDQEVIEEEKMDTIPLNPLNIWSTVDQEAKEFYNFDENTEFSDEDFRELIDEREVVVVKGGGGGHSWARSPR